MQWCEFSFPWKSTSFEKSVQGDSYVFIFMKVMLVPFLKILVWFYYTSGFLHFACNTQILSKQPFFREQPLFWERPMECRLQDFENRLPRS